MSLRKVLGLVAGVALLASPVWSADHGDGPAVQADPAADINDLFVWMSPDASKVQMVLSVFPNATEGARFSDSVQYVFHVGSGPEFGAVEDSGEIVCIFNSAQDIQCWAGDTSVMGDASSPAGLMSNDGRLRVFAGMRNDPFFFNLSGFLATTSTVVGAAGGLTFDDAGCPALDSGTSTALVTQLMTEPGGDPAIDDFAGANVLAIALEIDKSLVTQDGSILGVWASTNRSVGASACVGDADRDGEVRIHELVVAVNNALRGCESASPPVLGLQIERMGRSAINTAVVDPFFADPAEHGRVQDGYNAANDSTAWADLFAARMAGNLAILDSLDTDCGNQLLAGADPVEGRYGALAGVLADDRLFVNTDSGDCQQYLAVEGNALGITNSDCGGRTPLQDTVDTSYSVLAIGALTGVGDGVDEDPDAAASLDIFPFLADPS